MLTLTDRLAALPCISLRGVRLHALTEAQCVRVIVDELVAGHGGWVFTPNVELLRQLCSSPEYARMCSAASLVVADGMPLIWASRLQGTPLPERVAGSNLVSSLADAAAANDLSLFLVGGNPGSAEGAARRLGKDHRGLDIRGTFCPPKGFLKDASMMDDLAAALAAARPDIVYVGIGTPAAEQLVERLRPLLPGTWWLTVGISISFLSGDVRRAPAWMQHAGLEWLHRLSQEPRRLVVRYVFRGLPFGASLLVRSFAARVRRAARDGTRSAGPT